MTNPLLTPFELPPFSKILPEHVVPAVTKALNDCRENVERVVAQVKRSPDTWLLRWGRWRGGLALLTL